MKLWLKTGIIGGILGIILSLSYEPWMMIVGKIVYFLTHCIAECYENFFLFPLIGGVIFGLIFALIGLVYEKGRRRLK